MVLGEYYVVESEMGRMLQREPVTVSISESAMTLGLFLPDRGACLPTPSVSL